MLEGEPDASESRRDAVIEGLVVLIEKIGRHGDDD
jgi:hypothetical protein